MPLYESTFIARHDISAQQVENLTETMANFVKENGGEVTKSEYWGLKNLAYRIKKNRKGHYVFFNLDAPSGAVHELERNLRLNEDVLRFLTVSVGELDPNASPMMKARAAREDRSRRGSGAPPSTRAASKPTEEPKAVSEATKMAKSDSGPEEKAEPDSGPGEEAKSEPESAQKAEAAAPSAPKAKTASGSAQKAKAAPRAAQKAKNEPGETA